MDMLSYPLQCTLYKDVWQANFLIVPKTAKPECHFFQFYLTCCTTLMHKILDTTEKNQPQI